MVLSPNGLKAPRYEREDSWFDPRQNHYNLRRYRLEAKDTGFSFLEPGFESRWRHYAPLAQFWESSCLLSIGSKVRVLDGARTNYCGVAQPGSEQRNHNPLVEGSNPSSATLGPSSSWLGHQLVTLEITGSTPVGPVIDFEIIGM